MKLSTYRVPASAFENSKLVKELLKDFSGITRVREQDIVNVPSEEKNERQGGHHQYKKADPKGRPFQILKHLARLSWLRLPPLSSARRR